MTQRSKVSALRCPMMKQQRVRTHFIATPIPFYCRLTEAGVGIHGGLLPGYPAAHGSIRVPDDVARFIYQKMSVGTKVEIRAE